MAIDRNVQTSLHGRRIGLNSTGDLVGDGQIIVLRDKNTNKRVFNYDDFIGVAITGVWDVQKGSDAACANFAVLAGTKSGVIRATTGAGAGATMAVNGVQLDQGLHYTAANGGTTFEAAVKISAITNVSLFVGLTNEVGTLQAPATLSVATFTFNAADCVGFLFDTAATTVTVRAVGNAASVAPTAIDSGLALVAATYMIFRIELDSLGNATFFINGNQVGSPMALAVTAATLLTPVIAGFARAAASRTVDVDYVDVEQDR
jgi:hypothetical protein